MTARANGVRHWFPGVTLSVGRLHVGTGARIGEGTVVVADELVLDDHAAIGSGCDVRSSRVHLGPHCAVGDGSRVLVADRFAMGTASRLDLGARITCRTFDLGDNSYIGQRFDVGAGASMEERSIVSIGSRTQIGPDVVINPTEPVTIGSDVGISASVSMWTHGYHTAHTVLDGHGPVFSGVTVEDGVWLAYHATVLPGVTVGARSIVAALAVVTTSLPADVLAAGVPARAKRSLGTAALSRTQSLTLVDGIVTSWLDRLRYKGFAIDPDGSCRWSVKSPDGTSAWTVARSACSQSNMVTLERTTGDGGGPGRVVIDFDVPSISGVLDALSHDLRDYCRRRTVFLPYGENSVAIVPARFARLLTTDVGPEHARTLR